MLFCGWLGVAALGSEADHSPIPNEAPLDFSFRDCGAHHEYLGPTVNIGNGLVVAFNGSHTRIMNSNVFQNGDAEDMGYWAWDIIDDGSGGSGPQAREGHAMAPLGNFSLIMFGGIDSVTNTPLDDSWIFQVDANDFSTGTWTLQTHGEADAPTARTHAMAPLQKKVLLYGGLGYIETEEPLDDVWIFEDDSWSQVNSSLHNSPDRVLPFTNSSCQRYGHDNVWRVFQGDNSSTTMQDTWVFDFGTRNWEEKKSSMLPPPRQGHATAYTKVFDVNAVLMFGGYSGTDPDFLEGNETQVLKDSWMFYVDSMTWKVAADFD